MKKRLNRVMLFSAFVWIVSNFHHPLTPSYFTALNLPSHVFGTSYAIMVFATFFTSPVWGSWADKHSRIKTIIYSTIIYGLSQIGFGLVNSLSGILFFRALAGIGNGGFSVGLMSAIVDTSTEENRSVNIANYSALMSVAMAVGFFMGGVLGYFPLRMAFAIQGISMILVGLAIKFFVGETNDKTKGQADSKVVFIWDIFKDAKENKDIFNFWSVMFLLITFFSAIAYGSNVNAVNYYMKEQLNFKPIINGIWKAVIGITGLIANMTINVWIIRKTKVKNSMMLVLLFTALSGTMIIFNSSVYPFMAWNLMYFILYTIQIPILSNFAVEGHSSKVGLMSGIFNAMKSLGGMFGSLIAGFAYNLDSKLPFVLGAVGAIIAFLLSLIEGIKRNQEA